MLNSFIMELVATKYEISIREVLYFFDRKA